MIILHNKRFISFFFFLTGNTTSVTRLNNIKKCLTKIFKKIAVEVVMPCVNKVSKSQSNVIKLSNIFGKIRQNVLAQTQLEG